MKRTPLRRKTPLRKCNPRRARQRYARAFGAYAANIRLLPCARCGQTWGIEAAHAIPRSRGGDRTMLVPLCRDCHRWVDANPRIREAYYLPLARALWNELGAQEAA